jgi:hypothetical protein
MSDRPAYRLAETAALDQFNAALAELHARGPSDIWPVVEQVLAAHRELLLRTLQASLLEPEPRNT